MSQVDEISRSIGSFESYIKESRQSSADLTKLIIANESLSCKRDEDLKRDLHTKFDKEIENLVSRVNSVDARLIIIEASRMRTQGVVGVGTWFLKNWPIAGLLSLVMGIVAWANGKIF